MLGREDRMAAERRLLAVIARLRRSEAPPHEIPRMVQNRCEALLPQIDPVGGRKPEALAERGAREPFENVL